MKMTTMEAVFLYDIKHPPFRLYSMSLRPRSLVVNSDLLPAIWAMLAADETYEMLKNSIFSIALMIVIFKNRTI